MVEPRVLVVSHNVFSSSGNMGKTMMHMLAGIPQIISHNCTSIRRFRLEDAVCTISE